MHSGVQSPQLVGQRRSIDSGFCSHSPAAAGPTTSTSLPPSTSLPLLHIPPPPPLPSPPPLPLSPLPHPPGLPEPGACRPSEEPAGWWVVARSPHCPCPCCGARAAVRRKRAVWNMPAKRAPALAQAPHDSSVSLHVCVQMPHESGHCDIMNFCGAMARRGGGAQGPATLTARDVLVERRAPDSRPCTRHPWPS